MAAEPLCTLEQVKTQLGITDTTQDALLNQLILSASAEILNAINRLDLLPNAGYDEFLCGNGKCKLYLKHYPITEVDAVILNGEVLAAWDGYQDSFGWQFLLDPNPENQQFIQLVGMAINPYAQNSAYGFYYSTSYFWPYPYNWPICQVPNIEVQYKAGYDAPPPALAQACIDLVAFKRSMSIIQASNPLLTARHMGDYSEDIGGARGLIIDFMGMVMPASVAAAIEQYQRIVV